MQDFYISDSQLTKMSALNIQKETFNLFLRKHLMHHEKLNVRVQQQLIATSFTVEVSWGFVFVCLFCFSLYSFSLHIYT